MVDFPSWNNLPCALDGSSRAADALPFALKNHKRTSNTVVFCSLSRLYLPKARVFAESLKRFHPDWEYHLVINDSWPEDAGSSVPDVDLIVPIRQLNVDRFHSWCFAHDAEELCCATRPQYFIELLNAGYEYVFFFDPDIAIFSSLDPLIAELDSSSVLLTPHVDVPSKSDAEIFYTEMSVLAHGIFNLGFLGTRNSPRARDVIEFWRHRLTRYSLKEHARGLWTDQKWFNLVPIYFPGVRVLDHQGCNVASWNISSRALHLQDGELYAGRDKLLFFHFSGYASGVPEKMYRIFRSFTPLMKDVFGEYTESVSRMERDTPIADHPWAFGCFDNGDPIPFAVRKHYRGTLDNRLRYSTPFMTGPLSYHDHVRQYGLDQLVDDYDPPGKLRRHF